MRISVEANRTLWKWSDGTDFVEGVSYESWGHTEPPSLHEGEDYCVNTYYNTWYIRRCVDNVHGFACQHSAFFE